MNAKTIARLYEIKKQIKESRDKIKELQPEEKRLENLALNTMLKDGASTTYKTSRFTISVGYRKSYEMPQWFRDQTEELKLSKEKAQKESSVIKTPYLAFFSKWDMEPVELKPVKTGQLHI